MRNSEQPASEAGQAPCLNRVKSVGLCDRPPPFDFRFTPLATEIARRPNMSRWATSRHRHLVDHLVSAQWVNAIPVHDYERVVDDVKCIRATIERFEVGRWRRRTACRSGSEAPAWPERVATPTNNSTEIYLFARSAAAVAMYFE